MTDTAELIARLRAKRMRVHDLSGVGWEDDPDCVAAAEALSSLVRERDEALEAAYDQPHGPTSRMLWSTRYGELLDDYKDERTRREAAEADAARMREALEAIDTWAKAYPLTVFPEPDFARVRDLLAAGGITVDAVSASNMRHVLDGIAGIVGAALSNTSEGGERG